MAILAKTDAKATRGKIRKGRGCNNHPPERGGWRSKGRNTYIFLVVDSSKTSSWYPVTLSSCLKRECNRLHVVLFTSTHQRMYFSELSFQNSYSFPWALSKLSRQVFFISRTFISKKSRPTLQLTNHLPTPPTIRKPNPNLAPDFYVFRTKN